MLVVPKWPSQAWYMSILSKERGQSVPSEGEIDYRELDMYSSNSMPFLDLNLKRQGFSKGAIKLARQAWRPGSGKVYITYIKQWLQFFEFRQIDTKDPVVGDAVNFFETFSHTGQII